MFSQWIAGQPWWLTVLMLPVWILLACMGFILKQLGFAALILGGVATLAVLVWRLLRRQRSKPGLPPTV